MVPSCAPAGPAAGKTHVINKTSHAPGGFWLAPALVFTGGPAPLVRCSICGRAYEDFPLLAGACPECGEAGGSYALTAEEAARLPLSPALAPAALAALGEEGSL